MSELIGQAEWLKPAEEATAAAVKNAFASAGETGQTVKNLLHGVFLGHPLHPAITDVPVGSWTVAAILDFLDLCGASKYRDGADAAVAIGLAGALPSALTGITDWSDTHGKPQRVGLVHGILNGAATVLYAGSYWARKRENRGTARLLGFVGYAFVSAGAYLGGDLSYSEKIGVNHAPDPEGDLPQEFTVAMAEADLQEDKPAAATVNNTETLLVKKDGVIYALANRCSHLNGPLNEGKLEGDSIVCPWHASKFCLRDGRVENGPATNNQPVLDVKVQGGQIMVAARKEKN